MNPLAKRLWTRGCNTLYRAIRVYVVFVILVYIFQDYLLYRAITSTPAQANAVAARLGLTTYVGATPWDNVAYTSLPAPASATASVPAIPSRGTIIVAHGNSRTALDGYVLSNAYTRLGFRVILYEYPGFTANPGRPSEEGCVLPLRRLVREVAALGESKIYLFGQSMGCGIVCSALADKTLPVAGAVLLQPWDELGRLADHHLFFLPCSYMVGNKYNSVANLAGYPGPVAFVICEKDTTIPPRFSKRLYDSYTGKKTWILLPGCDHNDWPMEPDAPWWKTVADYISPPAQASLVP
jgi:pimeloyl-ACP methyl ester carboxylesterase